MEKKLEKLAPDARAKVKRLHSLAVIDDSKPLRLATPAHWQEALYESTFLLQRQIYQLAEDDYLLLHPAWFLDKFFSRMPYVVIAAKELRDSDNDTTESLLSEFGMIFEAYAVWLLNSFFKDAGVVYQSVRATPDHGAPEHDIVVVIDDRAIVIEVNSHCLSLKERRDATAETLVEAYKDDYRKVLRASKLVAGGCWYSGHEMTQVKARIRTVLPVVLMHDLPPLHDLTVHTYERVLRQKIGEECVNSFGPIRPVQVLSIEELERVDAHWKLPDMFAECLNALDWRSSTPERRYERLSRYFRTDYRDSSLLLRVQDKWESSFLKNARSSFENPGEVAAV